MTTDSQPIVERIPPPPQAMLDMIVMQLEAAIINTPAPAYVKEAAEKFTDSLKRWGKEGV